MKSVFEQNGGTYTKVGDYYLPDLYAPTYKKYNIGKYGRLHGKFIKESRPCFYTARMIDGTWLDYLEQVDTAAKNEVERLLSKANNGSGKPVPKGQRSSSVSRTETSRSSTSSTSLSISRYETSVSAR